ncbi:large conductance mechanosensitive channel protein MscL [Flavobacterium sp. SUN052]|uniref:large conductance mechanosensitive channel protein MscL n=1 Tax=Flavobacterium sp. SUN052 TaxID=3002441 RepID=UPI00237E7BEF|nr:large conductance mechanosensitive channel protein MscL [Flavobacterium sp. SUN052]MEC4003281.1 large conductance mechanosensitive channel protein MscL [Flavobacterium sp. SUN052]
MGFFADFKASLMKGDVLSLATGVVIGGAFGKIVGSVVDDILMPIVGLITGGIDFTQKFLPLNGQTTKVLAEAKAQGAVMTYGNLVQAIITFVIIAFFVFIVLRAAEKAKKKEEAAPAAPAGPSQEELLTQIRDLLKK